MLGLLLRLRTAGHLVFSTIGPLPVKELQRINITRATSCSASLGFGSIFFDIKTRDQDLAITSSR